MGVRVRAHACVCVCVTTDWHRYTQTHLQAEHTWYSYGQSEAIQTQQHGFIIIIVP